MKLLRLGSVLSGKVRQFSSNVDTIFALSSGYGRCGVSVVRVSGPASGVALKAMTRGWEFEPRRVYLRKIYHGITRVVIDRGIVLWFSAPHSFTGEDSFELQVHGSPAVINAIFDSLSKIPSLRPAQAGEFTKRAFLNKKMDLTEVEGLQNLLNAETEQQRIQAFLLSDGHLSRTYHSWRSNLLRNLAHIEATLDFEETETLPPQILEEMSQNIQELRLAISSYLSTKGEIIKNGVKTVILGTPNVGKSSLLNHLCKKPKAIVSPVEGTTRDLLETTVDIGGYPLVVTDTAGLRERTDDPVEMEGISRAKESIKGADFLLFIVDVSKIDFKGRDFEFRVFFKEYLRDLQMEVGDVETRPHLVIFNKSDLLGEDTKRRLQKVARMEKNALLFSCVSNDGDHLLKESLTEKLEALCGSPSVEHPCMTQERHRSHLQTCLDHLNRFLERSNGENVDLVLLAEDLRIAMRQIGKLTGEVTTEDLLDVIFKDFCIGK